MHRKVAAALVAALLLAAAGCGGGDSDTLTRAQLASRVDRACERATTQAEESARAEARADRGESATSGFQAYLTSLITAQQDLIRRIEAYEPPEELSDSWAAFKRGLETRSGQLERAVAALEDGARSLSAFQDELEVTTRRLRASARRLGVENCA